MSIEVDEVGVGGWDSSLLFCWLNRSWQLGLWPGKALRIWILHCIPLCFVLAGRGYVTLQFLMCLRHPPTTFFSCRKIFLLKLILAFDTISEFFRVSTAVDYWTLPCKLTRIHLNLVGHVASLLICYGLCPHTIPGKLSFCCCCVCLFNVL